MQLKKRKNLNQIDDSWSLFLDRDGVINQRIYNGYVTTPEEFEFIEGVNEALKIFSNIFNNIFVVTNQQGIGKGVMSTQDLNTIHEKMLTSIEETGGRIDKVYYCGELKEHKPDCRKPQVGMALQAQKDFPEIKLKKSVMVGDTLNDMIFGRRLNMITVLVGKDQTLAQEHYEFVDYSFDNLLLFAQTLNDQINHINR
ncbi:MAG: D-glycero-alpha-D-manno-heptose-1,7-bisphosphate 7-phosphatase [Bacteroidales bacterium]